MTISFLPFKVDGRVITDAEGQIVVYLASAKLMGQESEEILKAMAASPELINACLGALNWYRREMAGFTVPGVMQELAAALAKAGVKP